MIRYMPKLDSALWERKSTEIFSCMEELTEYIADQRTRFNRFIGKNQSCLPRDVVYSDPVQRDLLTGWNNFRRILVDGRTVGYCGE